MTWLSFKRPSAVEYVHTGPNTHTRRLSIGRLSVTFRWQGKRT